MAFLWKHPQSKFWQARYFDKDGKRRNRSTKIEAKDSTRKKAQKLADSFEEAATKRRTARQAREVIATLHAELTGEEMPTLSMKKHVEGWIARKEPETSPATMSLYRGATTLFLEFLGKRADLDVAAITPTDIIRFRNKLSLKLAAGTVNLKVKTLRMVFKAAHRDGLISENPAEHVDTIKKEAGRAARRPFTVEELRTVLAIASPEWASMIRFGLYTGQRLSDLAALTWENIDTQHGEIRLLTRKTGRRMMIPMAQPLKDHVESLEAGDSPSQPIHPAAYIEAQAGRSGALSNQFIALLVAAGLRKPISKRKDATKAGRAGAREASVLSYHSLRATAATFMHDAGVPSAVVQELIGHDSEEVHRVYVKIGRESLRGGTDKLPVL
jgi:integrase